MERIAQAAHLDIGGIEYLVDDRDGQPYFYDVNALSNFVADPVNVIGFDPWRTFVDYIEGRIGNRESKHPGDSPIPDSRFPIPYLAEVI